MPGGLDRFLRCQGVAILAGELAERALRKGSELVRVADVLLAIVEAVVDQHADAQERASARAMLGLMLMTRKGTRNTRAPA
jgi:hypothetical protein